MPLSNQDSPSADAVSRQASTAAFEFVRELASELSSSTIELPSFPKVAAQVQKVLSEDGASAERVVRVLGAEPMLATRVLSMANSVALAPGGRAVVELKAAVARLGFDALRTAVIGYALAQLRSAPAFKAIERPLNAFWQHSVLVAALSFVLARRSGRCSADTAMLAGIVHGVGKLYIMTRAMRHPALFADRLSYQRIERDWHGGIAKALLENWRMADEIVVAVSLYGDPGREARGVAAALADILEVADALARWRDAAELPAGLLEALPGAQRMALEAAACRALLDESAIELTALRAALGS
jgi:HD-like signal output (HDOD) protein